MKKETRIYPMLPLILLLTFTPLTPPAMSAANGTFRSAVPVPQCLTGSAWLPYEHVEWECNRPAVSNSIRGTDYNGESPETLAKVLVGFRRVAAGDGAPLFHK
jgi:hypothetical protein